ncbi:type II toxin-antitoxin system VapB family antitoxin [Saccharomonospora iraqiensis]|uniref:type II toxin-antitoxin system VapB family antitoxin n=1 Tax=Saccharomonospora iraqiensis TaxID=52698 RepID=UPI00022E03C2
MGRTRVTVDDELVHAVMRRYDLRSRREAVDLALRRAARTATPEEIEAVRGVGWEGNSDEPG